MSYIPVSVSTDTLKTELSDDVMDRVILRQSLNGSSDCSPSPVATAPLTCRGREREVDRGASTREGRNSMSEGGTTNTCGREGRRRGAGERGRWREALDTLLLLLMHDVMT